VAAGEATAGRVHLVGGRADGVPLRDGVAGAAWLSTVIHHVGDLDACANELRRVLAPGAPVLIRSAFRRWRERLPSQRLADTILVGLTDDEFAAGLRALDAAIAAGRDPEAVGLDLLVLH
jgi:SAM-dependent methyltransferase